MHGCFQLKNSLRYFAKNQVTDASAEMSYHIYSNCRKEKEVRDMKTMGERIAEARRKAALTQQQIGDMLNVSYQAVSSWERDENLPETEKLIRLADELGVSLLYLVEGSEYEFETKKEIFNWEHMRTFVKTTAKALGMVNTQKALDFAIKAHEGQTRKNSDIPYIYHPLNLACHCLAMGIRDDSIIAACLLPDVLEDTGAREEDLPVDDETRKLVTLMSHEKAVLNRGEMLKEYYEGLSSDPKAALIKCVDRCNNLTTMSWGLKRKRQIRMIYETEKYVMPLLDVVRSAPEYNSAAWLLKYQMESMLDIYKRLL